MTFTKIITFGLFLGIVLAAAKIFLVQSFEWDTTPIAHYILWAIGSFFSVALVRRLGVITYLESFIVMGFWLIFLLIIDGVLVGYLVGYHMFATIPFWLSYLVVLLSIFLFHKKRHIAKREEMKRNAPPPKKEHHG